MLLGYDVSGDEVRRALAGVCATATRRRLIAAEHRLPTSTPTFRALSRARHDPEREPPHSPQEHLHAFLRSLDAKAERLPERFVSLLSARSRTTASTAWTARLRSRRPATGCSSPRNAPTWRAPR